MKLSTESVLLLALLSGPQTCKQLAANTGRHFTTTWVHLNALREAGLVRSEERLRSFGKPSLVWEATVERKNGR